MRAGQSRARRVWAAVTAGLLLQGAACSRRCETHSDCQGFTTLERCTGEVFCSENICQYRCVAACVVARSDLDPCGDGRICNSSPGRADAGPPIGICTGHPISCRQEADCPIYRPVDSSGLQHEWTCVSGFCRYPGFHYRYE